LKSIGIETNRYRKSMDIETNGYLNQWILKSLDIEKVKILRSTYFNWEYTLTLNFLSMHQPPASLIVRVSYHEIKFQRLVACGFWYIPNLAKHNDIKKYIIRNNSSLTFSKN